MAIPKSPIGSSGGKPSFTGAKGRAPVKSVSSVGKKAVGKVVNQVPGGKAAKMMAKVGGTAKKGVAAAGNAAATAKQKGVLGSAAGLAKGAAKGVKVAGKKGVKVAGKIAKHAAKKGFKALASLGPVGWAVIGCILIICVGFMLTAFYIAYGKFDALQEQVLDQADTSNATNYEHYASQSVLESTTDTMDSGLSETAAIAEARTPEAWEGGLIGVASQAAIAPLATDHANNPNPNVAGDRVGVAFLDEDGNEVDYQTWDTSDALAEIVKYPNLRQFASWILPQWAAPFPVLVSGDNVGDYDAASRVLTCDWPIPKPFADEWAGELPNAADEVADQVVSVRLETRLTSAGQNLCHLIAATDLMYDRWQAAFPETWQASYGDINLSAARGSQWFQSILTDFDNPAQRAARQLDRGDDRMFQWLSFAYAVADNEAAMTAAQTDCGLTRYRNGVASIRWSSILGLAYDPTEHAPQAGEDLYATPAGNKLLLLYPCDWLVEAVTAAERRGLWHPIAFLEREDETQPNGFARFTVPENLPVADCEAINSDQLTGEVANTLRSVCEDIRDSGVPYHEAGDQFSVAYDEVKTDVADGITDDAWSTQDLDIATAWGEFVCLFGYEDQQTSEVCDDGEERTRSEGTSNHGDWSSNRLVSWCSINTVWVDGLGVKQIAEHADAYDALTDGTEEAGARREAAKNAHNAAEAVSTEAIYKEIIDDETAARFAERKKEIEGSIADRVTELEQDITDAEAMFDERLANVDAERTDIGTILGTVITAYDELNAATSEAEAKIEATQGARLRRLREAETEIRQQVELKYAAERQRASERLGVLKTTGKHTSDIASDDFKGAQHRETAYDNNGWPYECEYESPAEARSAAGVSVANTLANNPPGNPVSTLFTVGGRGRGFATNRDTQTGDSSSQLENALRIADIKGLLPPISGESTARTVGSSGRLWYASCSRAAWHDFRCDLDDDTSRGRGVVLPTAWSLGRYPLRCPQSVGINFADRLADYADDWETAEMETVGRFGAFHPCLLPSISALDWLSEAVGIQGDIGGYGFRSFADSDALLAARPEGGAPVAPGGKSRHNYGLALDFYWRPPDEWDSTPPEVEASVTDDDLSLTSPATSLDGTGGVGEHPLTDDDADGDSGGEHIHTGDGGLPAVPPQGDTLSNGDDNDDGGTALRDGFLTCGLESGGYHRFILPHQPQYSGGLDYNWCWQFLDFATDLHPRLIQLEQLPSEVWHWSIDAS